MSMLPSVGPQRMGERNLSPRLDALAELVRIGRARQAQGARRRRAQGQDDGSGFSEALLDDAEAVLKRAGERLRLSSNHTVVALAGGTGSGKSTLFNALSGATFSPPGVTRPMTRHVHACVWGMQGAAPLLDWLGVQRRHRYARASVLDSGESDLDGLILLDLPDHDSVVTASMAAVDRLSKLADMVIWVLDPQKYADAAVHNRYLIPLAGHAARVHRGAQPDRRALAAAGQGLRGGPPSPPGRRGPAGCPGLPGLRAHRGRARRPARAAHGDGGAEPRGHRPDRRRHRRHDGGFAAYGGPQVAPDTALAAVAGAARRAAAAGRRPAEGARPSRRGTSPRKSGPRRSRRPAVPAAVGGRHPGRRQAGRQPTRAPASRGNRRHGSPTRSRRPRACPRSRRPWRAPARHRRHGSPAGRLGRLLGSRRDPVAAGAARRGPPRSRSARPSSPRWTTRSPRSPTRWAASLPRRGPAACARRPGATRAWCRRRSPARCRPRSRRAGRGRRAGGGSSRPGSGCWPCSPPPASSSRW